MPWLAVTQFNIGQGRTDAILIPFLLSSSHVAIKVTDTKRRKWRKAGDLWQQFDGGVRGQNIFVPLSEQRAIEMQLALGDYYLRFKPVSYHQGLFVEIWKLGALVYSLFSANDVPSLFSDDSSYELGVRIRFAEAGKITSVRYYKPSGESGNHTAKIWSVSGDLLYSVGFANETSAGWQTQEISPFSVTANTTYVISVNANSVYASTPNGLGTVISSGSISTDVGGNGVFNTTVNAFPTSFYNNTNYFRDIVFQPN